MSRAEELRGLLAKATKGPWKADTDCFGDDGAIEACVTDVDIDLLATIDTGVRRPVIDERQAWTAALEAEKNAAWEKAKDSQAFIDARLIAAAVNALPLLLDVVDAARAVDREAIRCMEKGVYDADFGAALLHLVDALAALSKVDASAAGDAGGK